MNRLLAAIRRWLSPVPASLNIPNVDSAFRDITEELLPDGDRALFKFGPIAQEVPNPQPAPENAPTELLAPAKPKRQRRSHVLTTSETPRWYARKPQLSANAYHDRSGWHEIHYMIGSNSVRALELSDLPDQLSSAIDVAKQHDWCGYIRYYCPDGLYCHPCRYLRCLEN